MLTREQVKQKWIEIIESVHKNQVFSSVEGAWQLTQWVEQRTMEEKQTLQPSKGLEMLKRQHKILRDALEKSVKLQSHYAKLLNMYDGGERMSFDSADKWIERLREVEEVNHE